MISVIIPTYNRDQLIRNAVQSVINQTYTNWELIIVDDGSTDKTREVVSEYIEKDPRIRYFYKENGGQGSARNLGIRESKGDYIAFLDSDDEWEKTKLEKQIKILENNSNVDFCYTADKQINQNGQETIKRFSGIDQKMLSFSKIAGIGISVPSSHLYKRKSFEVIGLFNEERDLIGLEDNEWSVRGNNLVGYYINEPLVSYRVHDGQITKESSSRYARGLLYILKTQRNIIKQNKKAFFFRLLQLIYLRIKNVFSVKTRMFLHKVIIKILSNEKKV